MDKGTGREGSAESRGGVESRVRTLEATVEQEAWARARTDKDTGDRWLRRQLATLAGGR